jgi:hypothetical protein
LQKENFMLKKPHTITTCLSSFAKKSPFYHSLSPSVMALLSADAKTNQSEAFILYAMTRTLQDYNPVGYTNPELQTKVGTENFETQDKVVACVLHD